MDVIYVLILIIDIVLTLWQNCVNISPLRFDASKDIYFSFAFTLRFDMRNILHALLKIKAIFLMHQNIFTFVDIPYISPQVDV